MNFPQVHGARIAAAPDPELVAAEARLAALDDDQVVDVDPVWVESVVEKVAAGRVPVRMGRLRRIAAAAVAFFALHGVATAATVTAVTAATVTAVVLWPERRNSSETMSYGDALAVLSNPSEPAGDRLTAMTQVSSRVRGVLQVLRELRDGHEVPPEIMIAAVEGLRLLAERRHAVDVSLAFQDPKGTLLTTLRDEGANQLDRLACLQQCVELAAIGMRALEMVPRADSDLRQSLIVANRRLIALLSD